MTLKFNYAVITTPQSPYIIVLFYSGGSQLSAEAEPFEPVVGEPADSGTDTAVQVNVTPVVKNNLSIFCRNVFRGLIYNVQGSHSSWKTWKNDKFFQSWKST